MNINELTIEQALILIKRAKKQIKKNKPYTSVFAFPSLEWFKKERPLLRGWEVGYSYNKIEDKIERFNWIKKANNGLFLCTINI